MKKKFENYQTNIQGIKMPFDRRKFLKVGGLAAAGTGLMLYSCENEDLGKSSELSDTDLLNRKPNNDRQVYNLGSGDVGILRYAYVLEQLEAAFYMNVVQGGYFNGANAEEQLVFNDIYEHELIHRDWFEQVLMPFNSGNSENVLPPLGFDFSSVDFNSRDEVMQTAILLEDTGVSAYNGAGPLLVNTDYLLLAGKIVSVEARHASTLRSLYGDTKYFAGDDVVDENGLDLFNTPDQVLAAASGFITTMINAQNLPSY